MKLGIILTNDWELFGNGSGDYFENQKVPLIELLKSINSHGFKLTVFAEVIQQFNLLQDSSDILNSKGIAKDWEDTIKKLLIEEHDVQLHIHPQLIRGSNEHLSEWSIANIKNDEMLNIIRKGKNYLESVLKEQNANYECIVFRAGGYAIQPSENVINNLFLAGIKSDSTVTRGLVSSFFNFRHSYSSYFPWFCKTDIRKKNIDDNSILELPIFSVSRIDMPIIRVMFPKLYYLLFHFVGLTKEEVQWIKQTKRAKTQSTYSIKEKYQAEASKSILKLLFFQLIQPYTLQFDYDKIPARVLIKYLLKKWKAICNLNDDSLEKFSNCYIPIVLIGHAKDHYSNYNIDLFLKLLKSEFHEDYESLSCSSFYNHYVSNLEGYELLGEKLYSNMLLK
jgi:hypothetical protein